MRYLQLFTISICIVLSFGLYHSQASFSDLINGGGQPTVRYCDNGECGLDEGTQVIKSGIDDLETDRSASEYIQDVVQYLLTFIALVSVIYIIYAGFQILIGNGDEEKLKKSRQTIVYVMLGIVVIFLAWPITLFILNLLNVS